jgi:hypothetical protein
MLAWLAIPLWRAHQGTKGEPSRGITISVKSEATRKDARHSEGGFFMDMQLRRGKHAIRQFLRTAYTDERLVWLLAHARSNQLAYQSCCCLIGVATADHPLRGKTDVNEAAAGHYHLARKFVGARETEQAYWELGYLGGERSTKSNDEIRRRRLIPLILSEIRRRQRARDAAVRELCESSLTVTLAQPES